MRDLIARSQCEVVVVSPSRLGTINYTLLTAEALKTIKNNVLKVVLAFHNNEDASTGSNSGVLVGLLAPPPVLPVPLLGANPLWTEAVERSRKKMQKNLARILA